MDFRFGFLTICVILDISFVSTIGDTIGTYAAQPVTPGHVAQPPYRRQPPLYNHHVTYTPDFVFPTENPPKIEPHMVALGRHNSDKTFTLMCGGTLISHSWVLTAAHCTYGPNGSPRHIRLGFHKLTDQNTGVIVDIKKMIRHPDYKPPVMYADIALIELVDAVTFTTSIRPACLFQPHFYNLPRRNWISGWGVTEFAGERSDPLLKAEVDLINNSECTNVYSNVREIPHGIVESMLCAGDSRGNWSRDTCQGDSGGPLQSPNLIYPCLFYVVGITSLGLGCAIVNTPGVYTRVPSYVTWIENIVWP